MYLAPMRFKEYVWPHNPRVYEISYQKQIAVHAVPFGLYMLRTMGRRQRVLRGEGEFAGSGAYAGFKRLASIFYGDTPGTLVHPLWDATTAYFVHLALRQEPTPGYVSYEFEFWECSSNYDSKLQKVSAPTSDNAPAAPAAPVVPEEQYYTAVWGDTLWGIAFRNGMSLYQLLSLNPQIRNPNILYVGDRIRIA